LRHRAEPQRARQSGRLLHAARSGDHRAHPHGATRHARRDRGRGTVAVQRRGVVRDGRRPPGGRRVQRLERCLTRPPLLLPGSGGPSWRCCSARPPSTTSTARCSRSWPRRSRASSAGARRTTRGSSPGSAWPTASGCSAWAASWIALVLGWRWAFLATGVLDLVWLGAWLAFYRDPDRHPTVSRAELAWIRSDPVEPGGGDAVSWRSLLRRRQAWVFIVGKAMTDP